MRSLEENNGIERLCRFVDFIRAEFGEENIKTIQEKHIVDKAQEDRTYFKYVVDFYPAHCPPKILHTLRTFEGVTVVYKCNLNPVLEKIFYKDN